MKNASSPLLALLAANTFVMADLYTVTLVDGTIMRYTSADIDLVYGGNTYADLVVKRRATKTVIGVEVDSLDFSVFPRVTDLVTGTAFLQAARSGIFDGATVRLERAFAAAWPAITGTLIMFFGRVSDVSVGRTEAQFKIKSMLELLNMQMPRNLYQTGCNHTLYDSGCAVVKATYTFAGTASGTPTTTSMATTSAAITSKAAGYFDQGVLTFASGVNNGVKRTVKAWDGTNFTFALPLPAASGAGDTFTVFAGCDKTQNTCNSKFSNLTRFRGFPYIPVPEASA
jgi:uncharacterized phage protein (TIGR02218 family)